MAYLSKKYLAARSKLLAKLPYLPRSSARCFVVPRLMFTHFTNYFQLGRFRRGPTPSVSVVIEGTCCWENFARSDYKGKMLRLCKGKYNANILGKMAGNIRSLRPVKHF